MRMYNDLVSSKLKKGYKPTGIEWTSNNRTRIYSLNTRPRLAGFFYSKYFVDYSDKY
jgi:hypothetical protein